jgi:hypothetical protein
MRPDLVFMTLFLVQRNAFHLRCGNNYRARLICNRLKGTPCFRITLGRV